MTPEQNLLIRKFYVEIAQDSSLFAGKNTTARQAAGICLDLLGYVLIKGKYVPIEKLKKSSPTYGQWVDYECEWESDTRRVEDEVNNRESALEASGGESSEDTEVRETILREDVQEVEGRREDSSSEV